MTKSPPSDFQAWERGDQLHYGAFIIKPKRDFGPGHKPQEGCPSPHGWVVTSALGTNVLPGATWGRSKDEALALTDIYAAVGGKADHEWQLSPEAREVDHRFWHMLRALQRLDALVGGV